MLAYPHKHCPTLFDELKVVSCQGKKVCKSLAECVN